MVFCTGVLPVNAKVVLLMYSQRYSPVSRPVQQLCSSSDKWHLVLLACSQGITTRVVSPTPWLCWWHLTPSAYFFSRSVVPGRGCVPSSPAALFSSSLPPVQTGQYSPSLSRGSVQPAISHPSQHFVVALCSQAVRRAAVSLFYICVTHTDREMPSVSSCFGSTN